MTKLARILLLLPLAPLLLLAASPSAAQDEPVTWRIVVHADNPVPEVSAKELSRIFYKSMKVWKDWHDAGHEVPIEPVDQPKEAEVRKAFSRVIFRKSASAIESYWQRKIITGDDVAPTRVSSDSEVLDYVREHRGAIGYVSATAPLGPGVRSLAISDVPTAEGGPFRGVGEGDRAETEVLGRRGDVWLLLAGSCGSRGEGRTAILQNRDGYRTVEVATETAYWLDGQLKSTRRHTHTLAGHEEIQLGCTRSGSAELRYSLAGSSDNSVPLPPVHGRNVPSRDFISLTESGTCGYLGGGRRISVVNRHPDRSILVFVESIQRVKGELKRRSVRSHRLEPGGEKELGCDRDGELSTEYAVLDAE